MKKVNRALRAIRKAKAAASTAWNRYSVHDREAVRARIEAQHAQLRTAEAGGFGPVSRTPQLNIWLAGDHNRYVRHIGRASKYLPHQGPRECARRVRQTT